jgi:hypothetical protein
MRCLTQTCDEGGRADKCQKKKSPALRCHASSDSLHVYIHNETRFSSLSLFLSLAENLMGRRKLFKYAEKYSKYLLLMLSKGKRNIKVNTFHSWRRRRRRSQNFKRNFLKAGVDFLRKNFFFLARGAQHRAVSTTRIDANSA